MSSARERACRKLLLLISAYPRVRSPVSPPIRLGDSKEQKGIAQNAFFNSMFDTDLLDSQELSKLADSEEKSCAAHLVLPIDYHIIFPIYDSTKLSCELVISFYARIAVAS